MMAIMFVTSTGFTLFSHYCLMDGDRTISTTPEASCCEMESNEFGTVLTDNCCIEDSNFIKFDFQAPQFRVNTDILLPVLVIENFTLFEPVTEIAYTAFDKGLPPPKSGREILSNIQLLLI